MKINHTFKKSKSDNINLFDDYLRYLTEILANFENFISNNIDDINDGLYNTSVFYKYNAEQIIHILLMNKDQLLSFFSNKDIINNLTDFCNDHRFLIKQENGIMQILGLNKYYLAKLFIICEIFFPYEFFLDIGKYFEYSDDSKVKELLSNLNYYEQNLRIALQSL